MCAECHSTALRKNFDAQQQALRDRRGPRSTSRARPATVRAPTTSPGRARRRAAARTRTGGNGLAVALDERKGVTWTPVPATGNAQRSAPRTTLARDRDLRAVPRPRGASVRRLSPSASPLQDTHRLARARRRALLRRRPDPRRGLRVGLVRPEPDVCGGRHLRRLPRSALARPAARQATTSARRATRGRSTTPSSHTHHAKGSAGRARASPATCRRRRTCGSTHATTTRCASRVPICRQALGTPNACGACHAKKGRAVGRRRDPDMDGTRAGRLSDVRSPRCAPAATERRERAARCSRSSTTPTRPRSRARARSTGSGGCSRRRRCLRSRARSTIPIPSCVWPRSRRSAASDPESRVRYLPRMLNDPVKIVRIEAARALAGPAESAHSRRRPRRVHARVRRIHRRADLQRRPSRRSDEPRQPLRARAATGRARSPSSARRSRSTRRRSRRASISPTSTARRAATPRRKRCCAKASRSRRARRALHHALGLSLVRQKRSADALRELGDAAKLRARQRALRLRLRGRARGCGQAAGGAARSRGRAQGASQRSRRAVRARALFGRGGAARGRGRLREEARGARSREPGIRTPRGDACRRAGALRRTARLTGRPPGTANRGRRALSVGG